MADDLDRSWSREAKVDARTIVRTILQKGMVRMKDLLPQLASPSTLNELIRSAYIVAVSPSDHVQPADRLRDAQERKLAKLKASGAKARKEAIAAAKDDLEAAIDQERHNLQMAAIQIGMKRRRADSAEDEPPAKRQAVLMEDDDDDEETVQDTIGDIFLRVNFTRFQVRLRNKSIESAVRKQYGEVARAVMRAILSLTEEHINSSQRAEMALASQTSEALTTEAIRKQMDKLLAIDKEARVPAAQLIKNIRELLQGGFVESCVVTSETDGMTDWRREKQTSLALVAEACNQLARYGQVDPEEIWLQRVDRDTFAPQGQERWQVAYYPIHRHLQQALIGSIVKARFKEGKDGKEAVRIIRILDTYGRLDEKHIAKLGMMPLKETRGLIDVLMHTGMVELQEVPKTADRLPSRSFYLWYVDWRRMAANLLEQMHQSIVNIQVRQAAEEAKHDVLRRKSQQEAVIADPTLLRKDETETLEALDQRHLWLDTAVFRILQDISILALKALDDSSEDA